MTACSRTLVVRRSSPVKGQQQVEGMWHRARVTLMKKVQVDAPLAFLWAVKELGF